MKCHYQVLEVPKDADDSQIKAAYRKLALKWHPDKNPENSEEAKQQFQLVQQAYEILSDRHERAWYDNHREQILRGSDSEFKDDSLNVFQYFTTTCFRGYGDDPEGFYSVYRNVFEKIAKEDLEFMEDKDEFCQIPSFGNSTSDYDEVVGPFYAYWTSYSTKKSYVWLDPYNIKETRDRRIIKAMEKENKKVRQKARKERNEEVRNLVAFVRKRDKRVQEHVRQVEAKILENRQKHEQISKQKRLERKKQLNECHSQPEWAKFDNVRSELEEIERHLAEQFGEQLSDVEEDVDEEDDSLYCVACNKVFKTPKAFQNHESSKKHKENLQILKDTMLDDENNISESSEEQDNDMSEGKEKCVMDEDNIQCIILNKESREKEKLSEGDITDSNSESNLPKPETKTKKKNRKPRNIIVTNNDDSDLEKSTLSSTIFSNIIDKDLDFSKSGKQKRKSKRSTNKPENLQTTVDSIEDGSSVATVPSEKSKKSSKRKENRNKKETDSKLELDANNCCMTCKSVFPSKNKLFDHLKSTGHSVYLPKSQKLAKQKKKEV